MNKADYIKKYGEKAYLKQQEQTIDWQNLHPTQVLENARNWARTHPMQVLARNKNRFRKGSEHYEKWAYYNMNGLRHIKNLIRGMHARKWGRYKQIIAPNSQLHHQWIPDTADYTGVALVEKDQHLHGIIDVIQILEGKITLFTEAEIRGGQGQW